MEASQISSAPQLGQEYAFMPSASAPQLLVRSEVSHPCASISATFWRSDSAFASAASEAAAAAASLSAYSASICATSYFEPQKSHSS